MALFETLVLLLLVAAVALQVARWVRVPYPTMLALAGALVALAPWAPQLGMDPHLALVLFVAPALLSAAYDTSPYELRRHWAPLVALALFAVLLTTAAVAWIGWAVAGLPLAAAIALGAIVAPPDAAAAQAVLNSQGLPRRTMTVLQGESLFNDAVALLVFGAAVGSVGAGAPLRDLLPALVLAVPGGVLLGVVTGVVFVALWRFWSGTLSSTILEFASTFGIWLAAERLHVSPVLAVVAYAMCVARFAHGRQSPRDRVHSFAVWDAVVFVLNVIAFALMGLQTRSILMRLHGTQMWDALGFAALVFAVVVVVRIVWVMSYRRVLGAWLPSLRQPPVGTAGTRFLVGWCGMRGILTLATAMSLPVDFPGRDLIVLSAFAVVLGTLVVQGATIAPLIRWLGIPRDTSLEQDVQRGRSALADVRAGVVSQRAAVPVLSDDGERVAVTAQREALNALLCENRLPEDAFRVLQEELDWRELSLTPHTEREITEA
ncbi:CPA1 family monovalent cation:H+ antiporter [Lysobacter niabensis]|uniref:CPA1 family monovalent cation:H+ antiporter n=1 Tax=Agrilutibacter niabensis TaxID=380628 RepID=A0ABU1VNP2_9GAMM|nr:cation:proton antiporter [Lysobacter niabensis]MDR7098970.1 CPA1 family monovalent cation:H+ antiporter [Lysobacter niabensis]